MSDRDKGKGKRKEPKKVRGDTPRGQGPREFDPLHQDEHPSHENEEFDPKQQREYNPFKHDKPKPADANP